MKKAIALTLSLLILFPILTVFAAAIPLSAGTEQLKAQFIDGSIPNGNDYVYYSPVRSSYDTRKYPLLIWLHGGGSYPTPRSQIRNYDTCNLACDEYQAMFTNAGGCFILAPRDNGLVATSWEVNDVPTLKALIDAFIREHQANIDTNRLYLVGFSTGASMVWNMLSEYPNFFAAAVPASALIQPTDATINAMKNISIWIFSSDVDSYPSARSINTKGVFNKLRSATNRPDGLRLTTFSEVVLPDGSKKGGFDEEHYTWLAITHNLRMNNGSTYAYTTTVDGTGSPVSFSDGSGFFDWLSHQSKNGIIDDEINDEEPRVNPFATVIALAQNILGRLLDLLKKFLGLA